VAAALAAVAAAIAAAGLQWNSTGAFQMTAEGTAAAAAVEAAGVVAFTGCAAGDNTVAIKVCGFNTVA
jgi:hypothetical protein